MANDTPFERNLLSLELQLKTIFEEVGGESALKFLGKLSKLNRSEQELILETLSNLIDRIERGDTRLNTDEDQLAQDFEDGLFNDIVASMKRVSNESTREVLSREIKRLRVLDGGKTRESNNDPVCLSTFRRSKIERRKTIH